MCKYKLWKPYKIYVNSRLNKDNALQENKNKAGIYLWYNAITGKYYVGRSIDLTRRLLDYYNPKYLNKHSDKAIIRDLLDYGHSNFDLIILECCEDYGDYGNYEDYEDYVNKFMENQEQYYIDLINPEYNIQKKSTKYTPRKGCPITITNIKDNTTKNYLSIRAAARHTKINYSILLCHLKNNKLLNKCCLITKT